MAGRLAEAGKCAQSALAGPLPAPRPGGDEAPLAAVVRPIVRRPACPEARALAEDLLGEPEPGREARDEAEITLMLARSMSAGSRPTEETGEAWRSAEAILARAGQESQPRLAAALLIQAMRSWQAGQLATALDIRGRRPGSPATRPG